MSSTINSSKEVFGEAIGHPVIYSIGYEAMELEAFLAKLLNNQVSCLIDVRERPISRKKGFSKSRLSSALQDIGISYNHIKELGSPGDARKAFHSTKDWVSFFECYTQHIERQSEILKDLLMSAQNEVICLMCFERDYRFCHRSIIANKLEEFGDVEVKHL